MACDVDAIAAGKYLLSSRFILRVFYFLLERKIVHLHISSIFVLVPYTGVHLKNNKRKRHIAFQTSAIYIFVNHWNGPFDKVR